LGALLNESSRGGLRAAQTNSLPRAKAIIQLYMHGGPSHVDLLDPKPQLNRWDGTPPPAEVADDENRTKLLAGSPFRFRRCGRIAVVRSMFTEHRNHEQAIWMAQTGLTVAGRPTLGAWLAYGLGSENENLPAFVALPDPGGLSVDGIRIASIAAAFAARGGRARELVATIECPASRRASG
jgi:hypothetical protein